MIDELFILYFSVRLNGKSIQEYKEWDVSCFLYDRSHEVYLMHNDFHVALV